MVSLRHAPRGVRLPEPPREAGSGPSPLTLCIEMLGGFALSIHGAGVHDEAPRRWRLRKAQQLVQLLALAPRHRLARVEIEAALWPDRPPSAQANNFHQALLVARRSLGPLGERAGVLRLRDGVLWLAPECAVSTDVERFEAAAAAALRSDEPDALRRALELYAGELLPAAGQAPWVERHREALRGRCAQLLLRLAEIDRRRGFPDRAADHLLRAIEFEPTLEVAHASLIQLDAATGRPREALARYRRLEELLARDLDAEPMPETRALHDSIRASLAPPAQSSPPPAGGAGQFAFTVPRARTSFVGRQAALRELDRHLDGHRFVTITGPGGSGKSRLAFEWIPQRFPLAGDAAVVELAPAVDGSLVLPAVARALAIAPQPGQTLWQTVSQALAERPLMLVLDNCEHVRAACASLVGSLLPRCGALRILATSRVPLGLDEELIWSIPPLDVPSITSEHDRASLLECESVQLFLERARLANPRLETSEASVRAIAEICARFGELPLAVETIAARARTLPLNEIAGRLDRGLDLMARERDAPGRHQSMKAALDWSYDLLSRSERTLLRRLAVFHGTISLDAVEEICAGGRIGRERVLDLFLRLVDQSLVQLDHSSGAPSYRLLEPIRQYAHARAVSNGELDELRSRHARYYADLAERAEAALQGPDQPAWLERLEREHDNLRAALNWATECPEAREAGFRIARGVWRFWQVHNHHEEARRWIARLLADPGDADPLVVAGTFNSAGNLARDQADFAAAREQFLQCKRRYSDLGDRLGVAHAVNNLGLVARDTGAFDEAQALADESLELYRSVPSRFGEGLALLNLGQLARARGEIDRATQRYEESLRIFRSLDDRWHVASVVGLLAQMHAVRGRLDAARDAARECLELQRAVGDEIGVGVALRVLGRVEADRDSLPLAASLASEALQSFQRVRADRNIPGSLVELALLLRSLGRDEASARVLASAVALRDAVGMIPPRDELARFDEATRAVVSAVGEAAWAEARVAGIGRGVDATVEFALAALEAALRGTTCDTAAFGSPLRDPRMDLTPREREIATKIALGRTNRQIAADLRIGERTVETHIRRMLAKLGGSSRTDIATRICADLPTGAST